MAVRQVMPALKEQRDEALLKELHKRWSNHNLMVRWLSRFFNYLDRYYISRHSLSSLADVGLICFRGVLRCTTCYGLAVRRYSFVCTVAYLERQVPRHYPYALDLAFAD